MAKRVDITDKLNFEENPVLVIKGKDIGVNNDASTVLKIMAMTGDDESEVSPKTLVEMAEMLFTKQGKKNLDSLHLNIMDYSTVIENAMNLITGENEETGEF